MLSLPDRLESVALLPARAAAGATSNMHHSTCVLNAAFDKPALMIPDVTETYQLSDGRLELGLGAGYVQRDLAVSESPPTQVGPMSSNSTCHSCAEGQTAEGADYDCWQRQSSAVDDGQAQRYCRPDGGARQTRFCQTISPTESG